MAEVKLPKEFLDHLMDVEGWTSTPKWDVRQWSVGYGTRAKHKGERITRAEGKRRLIKEATHAYKLVNKRFPNIPQNKKIWLTDLTYNAGAKWMGAGLGAAVRRGDWKTANHKYHQYLSRIPKYRNGLLNRRKKATARLFNAKFTGMVDSVAEAPEVKAKPIELPQVKLDTEVAVPKTWEATEKKPVGAAETVPEVDQGVTPQAAPEPDVASSVGPTRAVEGEAIPAVSEDPLILEEAKPVEMETGEEPLPGVEVSQAELENEFTEPIYAPDAQQREAEQIRQKADAEYTDWSDFYKIFHNNFTLTNLRHFNETLTPEYFEDPNFVPDEKKLGEIADPEQQRYVGNAPNAYIFDQRLAEIEARKEADELWGKAGPVQTIAGFVVGTGLDLAMGVALGTPVEKAAHISRLGQSLHRTYGGRAALYGSSAIVSSAPEFAAAYTSGQMSATQSVLWATVGAGGIGGAAGTASKWMSKRAASKRSLVEAAEDAVDIEAKAKGQPTPKAEKIDPQADADLNGGTPSRPKVTFEADDLKHSDLDSAGRAAAREASEADTALLGKAWSTRGAILKGSDIATMFKRQAEQIAQEMKVYVRTPKGLTDFDAVKAYRSAEAVPKGPGRVREITLPPASKVLASDEGLLLGDGKIVEDLANAPKKGAVPAKFEPNNPKLGPKFLKQARYASDDMGISEDLLAKINDDIEEFGDDADVFQTYRSVGAAGTKGGTGSTVRLDGEAYGLSSVNRSVKAVIENPEAANVPEQPGWLSRKFAIARGNALATDEDPVSRLLAVNLIEGVWDLMPNELKKGMVRPRTADQVAEFLERKWDAPLIESKKKNFATFKEAVVKAAKEKGEKLNSLDIDESFEYEVVRILREWEHNRASAPAKSPYPGVNEHVQAIAKMTKDIADHLEKPGRALGDETLLERGVMGFDQFRDKLSDGYLRRIWSYGSILQKQHDHGKRVLHDFLRQNMEAMHMKNGTLLKEAPDVPKPGYFTKNQLREIAYAMADKIIAGRGGWEGVLDGALARTSPEEMIRELKAFNSSTSNKISDDTFEALKMWATLRQGGEGESGAAFAKNKGMLDPQQVIEMTDQAGKNIKLRLEDFLENNATDVMRDYARKAAGHVGLATVRIPDGQGGFLVNQITNAQEWRDAVNLTDISKAARAVPTEKGVAERWSSRRILDEYYNYRTHNLPQDGNTDVVQLAKMMGIIRYGGNFLFPQLSETVNAVAEGGLHTIRRIGHFNQMLENFKHLKTPGMNTALKRSTRFLMSDMGFGTEVARNMASARVDDGVRSGVASRGMWGARKGVTGGKYIMYHAQNIQDMLMTYGGLSPATSWTTFRTIEGLNDEFVEFAQNYGSWAKLPQRHRARYQNAGLSAGQVDSMMRMMRDVAEMDPNIPHQIADFNTSHASWDPVLFRDLQHAFTRRSQRAVQVAHHGLLLPGMDHPYMKLFMQLKTFMLASFSAQLVNNTSRGARAIARGVKQGMKGNWSTFDGAGDAGLELLQVGYSTIGQMMSGALMYVTLQSLANMGASREEYWRRMGDVMELDNLLLAGISRSGWLGSAAFMWDTAAPFAGVHSSFAGYRSSGIGSTVLTTPALSHVADTYKAGGAITDLIMGEGDTKDAQKIGRVMNNVFILDAGIELAARGLGVKEHKKREAPKSVVSPLTDILGITK